MAKQNYMNKNNCKEFFSTVEKSYSKKSYRKTKTKTYRPKKFSLFITSLSYSRFPRDYLSLKQTYIEFGCAISRSAFQGKLA